MNTVESVGATSANPGTSRLQRRGGTDNLLEHEAFFDLVPQCQILPIEPILERPDLCVSMLLLAQVERKRDAFVSSCVTQGSADQHGDATAIFPEELLLVGLNRPCRLEIRRRAFVSLAPFSWRQIGPAQTTRDEIVTTVLQHVEKRVIGLKNPSVEIPHENPDNVGIHQASHASPEQGGYLHLFVLFCGSRRLRSDGVRVR
jgi:hypothetical protein